MSAPRPPMPAKLVIGIFLKDKSLARPVAEAFELEFGPADLVSPWFPFLDTAYYEPEMGAPLFRRMFAFRELVEQDSLSDIKLVTNRIESAHLQNGMRTVNIDPGYLLYERFVLATGKNFAHRIHTGKGIYADLTLIWQNGNYRELPWTYPDYARENVLGFLGTVRDRFRAGLKERNIRQ